jgi:hypothetical protein
MEGADADGNIEEEQMLGKGKKDLSMSIINTKIQ